MTPDLHDDQTSSMHPVQPIRRTALRPNLPPGPHSIGQLLQHTNRGIPVNTCIGDTHTTLDRGQAATIGRRGFLVALVDVGFDHDADDSGFAFAELVANRLRDFGLVAVVFLRVAFTKPESAI